MPTPNGTRISCRSRPIAAAIAEPISGPTRALVGQVGLVAEQHAVDAGRLESLEVAAEGLDEVLDAAGATCWADPATPGSGASR